MGVIRGQIETTCFQKCTDNNLSRKVQITIQMIRNIWALPKLCNSGFLKLSP